MAYISINNLPELKLDALTGSENLLVTDNTAQSKRLQLSTFSTNMTNILMSDIDVKVQNIVKNKIDSISAEYKINVFDEGKSIGTSNKINFIGPNVNSFLNDETGTIDVFIPGATISSMFNKNDFSSDATVKKTDYVLRHISRPSFEGAPFSIGDWPWNSLQKCVNSKIIYEITNKVFVHNISKFTVKIMQKDNKIIDLSASTLDGTYENQYLKIVISNRTKELNHYTINFKCEVDPSIIDGRFTIIISYESDYQNIDFIEDDLFYDSMSSKPTILFTPKLTNYTYKYLSGVKYVCSGTHIDLDYTLIDAKNPTYPDILVDYDGTNAGSIYESYTVDDIGFTNYDYNKDIVFNKNYALLNNKFYNGDLSILARVNDWNYGEFKTETIRGLVDTYVDNSTRVYEDFTSETNRLSVTYLTKFNSNEVLSANELQVYNSSLVYPSLDFSEFYSNPDYRNQTGNKSFLRKFWHNDVSHSNGIFQLNGTVTENEIQGEIVKIMISLDGANWFDCGKDYLGGRLYDGDGCRINYENNNLFLNNRIEFTLGLNRNTNFDSSWGIFVKITYSEAITTRKIDVIQITNWN